MTTFVNWIRSATTSSNMQSFEQLGVAVCLTFLIAGPTVRSLLQRQLTDMEQLRATITTLIESGIPDEELKVRQELIDNFRQIVERSMGLVAPQTPQTALFYIIMCVWHLAFLTWCSLASTIPTAWACVEVAAAVLTVLMDPIRVWSAAKSLAKEFRRFTDFVGKQQAISPAARLEQVRKVNEGLATLLQKDPPFYDLIEGARKALRVEPSMRRL